MWFLVVFSMVPGCKPSTPAYIDVRRICQVGCASELRTDAERSVCVGQVLACEESCEELLDGEGRLCVECLETNGIFGPVARDNEDGALVCEPGEVTRGGCTHICPFTL